MKILSTKILSDALLQDFPYKIRCENFIEIELEKPEKFIEQIPKHNVNYIISSSNAIKAIERIRLNGNFFVVGNNTSLRLQSLGYTVANTFQNAEELRIFLQTFPTQTFYFLCGNLHRKELFHLTEKASHQIEKIIVYYTALFPKTINENFDTILFFSPSAVQSFFINNNIPTETPIFAIGKTTAKEIENIGNFSVFYPEIPSERAVLELVKKVLDAKK